MSSYTYDATEIARLEQEVRRLEYEQQQLQQRYENYKNEIDEIDRKITSCRNKIEKYQDLVHTIENYEYDRKFYIKKAVKKALFPGILGVAAGYVVGGIIANAAIGAVLGVLSTTAAIVGAAIFYCREKLAEGREVAKKYSKTRLETKIQDEEKELKKQNSLKETKSNAAKPVMALYQKNNADLSDLRLRHSVMTNPVPVNQPQNQRPFQKKKN